MVKIDRVSYYIDIDIVRELSLKNDRLELGLSIMFTGVKPNYTI